MARSRVLAGGLWAVFSLAACNQSREVPKPPPLPAAAPAPAPTPTPPPAPAAAAEEPEAVPAPPEAKDSISGTITLPAARKKDVGKGDTLYIVARKAGGPGPGMMLAVQKHAVGDFPMAYQLSNRDVMVPGTPFEGEINLSVRVDKDGDPMTRKKGDVSGQALGVKVGSKNIDIALDTVQKEDQVLGAPGMGGQRPHGMPPGHP